MIDNLKDQNKKVIFWNWDHYNARSLVIRYNTDFKEYFKFSNDINDLFYELKLTMPSNVIVS